MGCCQAHPELHRTPSGKEGIEDELVIEVIKSKYGGEEDGMMKLIARLDEIWEQYDQD